MDKSQAIVSICINFPTATAVDRYLSHGVFANVGFFCNGNHCPEGESVAFRSFLTPPATSEARTAAKLPAIFATLVITVARLDHTPRPVLKDV
jgi:hypothetical protein